MRKSIGCRTAINASAEQAGAQHGIGPNWPQKSDPHGPGGIIRARVRVSRREMDPLVSSCALTHARARPAILQCDFIKSEQSKNFSLCRKSVTSRRMDIVFLTRPAYTDRRERAGAPAGARENVDLGARGETAVRSQGRHRKDSDQAGQAGGGHKTRPYF